jgi:cation:H+ antiporter
LIAWLYVIAGVGALTLGADLLVKGAAGLALGFGVGPLVVGLTVVAFGTSTPELVVGITAALQQKPDIALGNTVGSNLANLGVILGITALIHPPRVDSGLLRRELPVLALSSAVIPLLAWDGTLSRGDGALLLVSGVIYVIWMLRTATGSTPGASVRVGRLKMVALTVTGLVLLIGGGKLFVDGSVAVARTLGMSERLIGLTLVAVGTSLPELATSLFASLRGQSSIAVGNVIGSNIFNVFFILGAAALAHPLDVDVAASGVDWIALGVLTLLSVMAMRSERVLSRVEGAVFVVLYAAFVVHLAGGW